MSGTRLTRHVLIMYASRFYYMMFKVVFLIALCIYWCNGNCCWASVVVNSKGYTFVPARLEQRQRLARVAFLN